MSLSRNQQNFIIMTIVYEALLDSSVHKNEAFRSFHELINNDSLSAIVSATEEVAEVEVDPYIKQSVEQTLAHYVYIINLIKMGFTHTGTIPL